MTEVIRCGDVTQTTSRCFAEDGIERWSTINTGPQGDVVSEMQGTNTRR